MYERVMVYPVCFVRNGTAIGGQLVKKIARAKKRTGERTCKVRLDNPTIQNLRPVSSSMGDGKFTVLAHNYSEA